MGLMVIVLYCDYLKYILMIVVILGRLYGCSR